MSFLPPSPLYFITDSASSRGRTNEEMARLAIAGGAGIVQLREKRLSENDLLAQARALREITHSLGALLIVNDRVDLALNVGADGVHVGQQDVSVAEARAALGPGAVIGGSAETMEQALAMEAAGASYIANSLPVFPSSTKPELPAAGLGFIRRLAEAVSVPVCAIGGITAENVGEVVAAGASLVAVISAITTADNPTAASADIARRANAARARNWPVPS